MNKARKIHVAGALTLAACALAMTNAASAQDDGQVDAPEQEIVIIAPRPITAEIREKGPGGRETAVISLKMTVQYGDLDLSKPEEVDQLMIRIRSVARDACKYLDRLYPLDPDPDCRERAVAHAKPQADEAIAAAMR